MDEKINVSMPVFRFDALDEKTQSRVINETVESLINYQQDYPEVQEAIAKNEATQTPWFTGETLYHEHKDFVMAFVNDAYYHGNGDYFGNVDDIQADEIGRFWNELDQETKLIILESAHWSMQEKRAELEDHLDIIIEDGGEVYQPLDKFMCGSFHKIRDGE